MNKRNAILCAIAASCVALVGTTFALATKPSLPVSSLNEFALTADSYSDIFNGTTTTKGNNIAFGKTNLTSEGGKPKLAKEGYIYNTTKISGIQRVKVTLMSGSVNLYYSYNNTSNWSDPYEGTNYDLSAILPNYFKIQATAANTVIDKIEVSYACVDYQGDSAAMAYSLYVNGEKSESIFVDATKPGEGYDKQYKAVLDVYPGDVLSFKYNSSDILPTASGDGNNAWRADRTRNLAIVSDYAQSAELYLKKTGNAYDIWLTGKGGSAPKAALQSAPILQAWNWSVSTISSQLDNIAAAGFKAVQVSPMQVRKYVETSSEGWPNQWWKLYQPFSFSLAEYADESAIGTKAELTALCAAAKAKGIGIIMDVVVNHLSGGNAGEFAGDVSYYENEIYTAKDGNNKTGLFHKNGKIPTESSEWDEVPNTLIKAIGDYPDLMTEDIRVQRRALSLFKECLDCGVTGFRIDAAKHIETPEDGQYGSAFWPHVVNGSKRYAALKGYDVPFYYGEILGVGNGRYYSWYTPYMSITCSDTSVRDGVNNGQIGGMKVDYFNGIPKDRTVVWDESHDTYKSGETGSISAESLNKVYAIHASRSELNPVYLARPTDGNTRIGQMGETHWSDAVVAAANKLHNRFINAGEWVDINHDSNPFYVVTRGSGSESGAMAAQISGTSNFWVNLPNMAKNTTYKNLSNGGTVTVNNDGYGELAVNEGVCVLVPNNAQTFYYLVGNSTFTGSESTAWKLSGGQAMTAGSGMNVAEIENIRLEEGAEVRIMSAEEGASTGTYLDNTPTLGGSYSYCEVNGNNLRFTTGGTYSIYRSQDGKYYLTGTPDSEPEQSSSASSSASSSSTPASKTYTGTWSENWIASDGCKVFVWAWGGDCGAGQWVSVALSGNGLSGSFTVTSEIDGFLFVRCVSTTTTPNWSTKGDSAGRIYNKTGDITASSGTYSYATSWQGYNP